MSMKCVAVNHSNGQEMKIAWAAGFFDGDGCTAITKQWLPLRKNPTYRLRLVVAQNCLETLQVFLDALGEHGFFSSPKETLKMNKRVHYLIYEGRHALAVLNKLLPYLVRKPMGAKAAMLFWQEGLMGTLPGPKGLPPDAWVRREYWFKKIKLLDKR